MARPKINRHVSCDVQATYFKPQGIPLRLLEEVELSMDELEAIRLADAEGLYQADAALKMGISRPTFGNILASAHRKIAIALLHGKALRIGAPDDTIRLARAAIENHANPSSLTEEA